MSDSPSPDDAPPRDAAWPTRPSDGPLRGVRVLDLSIALSGPYVSALLADQGADVIKVERPDIGDIARFVGVAVNGMSALFLVSNRGKRSITLDLRTDEGRDIIRRLAVHADVVIQNFRPGVLDRRGLGYDDLSAINPELVYLSISGFGSVGPYRDRSAYDTVIQSYAGFATAQADPEEGTPVFLRQTAADKVSALFATQSVTAALFARAQGRGGQHVEVSMTDAVTSFLWADAAGNEVLMAADGSQHSSFSAGFAPMAFKDGWGIVTPTADHDFAGMCRALEVEGFDDPRVATVGERLKHRDVMSGIMDMCYAKAANLTMEEATERLTEQRVPFSMILSPDELTRDPHAVAMGLFVESEHQVVGPTRLPRHPNLFSGTPAELPDVGAPALGEHTETILADLGLADRVAELRAADAIA